jgi:hypothetical protein
MEGFRSGRFILIEREENEDLDLFLERHRKISRQSFTADNFGRGPLAKRVNDSFRNGETSRSGILNVVEREVNLLGFASPPERIQGLAVQGKNDSFSISG